VSDRKATRRCKVKYYTVEVITNKTEYWEIKADSEQDAMDNYLDGEFIQTKFHGDSTTVVDDRPVGKPRNRIKPVEYDHDESKLLTHISSNYNSWRYDTDIDNGDEYWDHVNGYDINIYNSREYDNNEFYKYSVVCYGLLEDHKGNISINTDHVIAEYYIRDGMGFQLIKKQREV